MYEKKNYRSLSNNSPKVKKLISRNYDIFCCIKIETQLTIGGLGHPLGLTTTHLELVLSKTEMEEIIARWQEIE